MSQLGLAILLPDLASAQDATMRQWQLTSEGNSGRGLNEGELVYGAVYWEVGRPEPGEMVVISAAAGATGSTAVQISRALDCSTIGIAGKPVKCEWIVEELGAARAIDYKSENAADRLAEL